MIDIIKTFDINMTGRNVALNYINENNLFDNNKDIYLYGIYSGASTYQINNTIKGKDYNKIYGFDSFIGLPAESENVNCFVGHKEGAFSSRDFFQGKSISEIKELIYQAVNNPQLELISGFYNETLTDDLVKKLKPALYIDVDVDLYKSTIELLDFMFRNNLILKNCVIYFDDFGGVKLNTGGESLAWKEMTEKYNIKYKEIWTIGTDIHVAKVFVIL